MLLLPDHVRSGQQHRGERAAGRPPGPQRRARPEDEQRRRQHDRDQANLRLGLDAEADDHARGKHAGAAAADDRPDREPAQERRAEHVEGGRRDEVARPPAQSPTPAVQAAAMSCARVPPPASRAISAARIVVAAAASADGVRSRSSEPGAIAFIAQHSSGTSGGWSG